MTLADLLAQWRTDAATLGRRGCAEAARLLESCAEELDRVVATGQDEAVTLAEAARLSGYTAAHLRHLNAEGKLRDVAQTGRARVRRGDLPRKPGYRSPARCGAAPQP